jgi:hypothetical protein
MHIVPTDPTLPSWVQDTELDGAIYRLAFNWSERDSAWYLTLSTPSEEVIRAGIKLVPHFPLLRKVRHASRPPGDLFVITTAAITRDNLGTDARLVYFTLEDLAQAVAE